MLPKANPPQTGRPVAMNLAILLDRQPKEITQNASLGKVLSEKLDEAISQMELAQEWAVVVQKTDQCESARTRGAFTN